MAGKPGAPLPMTDPRDPVARALALPIWRGVPTAVPLGRGITHLNVLVTDADRRAVVRIGDDIPVHQIMRFNELAASRAAHAAGISPEVIHHAPGALVIAFIAGRTMTAEDLRQDANLEAALQLVMRVHRDIPGHLRGPVLTFWVFQVLRDYAATLREAMWSMVQEIHSDLDFDYRAYTAAYLETYRAALAAAGLS